MCLAWPLHCSPTGRAGEIGPGQNFPERIPRRCLEEIDAHIERQVERLNIPGVALAIVEDDEIAHLRGFGRARPGGEAPTTQTPFIIGSLVKSFTALAVMQLVEDGKVELMPQFSATCPGSGG